MTKYVCQFCKAELSSAGSYLSHYKLHGNVKHLIYPCCMSTCSRTFVKFNSLKCHISRDHEGSCSKLSANILRSSGIIHLGGAIVCCLAECRKKMGSVKELISHCKTHMSDVQHIPCPYSSCTAQFNKHTSFTAHISRKHRAKYTSEDLKVDFLKPFAETGPTSSNFDDLATFNDDDNAEKAGCSLSSDLTVSPISDLTDIQICSESEFKHSLALFFLKMESVYLVPVSTIQLITKDFSALNRFSLNILLNDVLKKVSDINDRIEIKSLFETNLLLNTLSENGDLSSHFKRKRLFKHMFNFVEPIEIKLGLDHNNKPCSFHYIPVKDTIRALFKNESFQKQYKNSLKNNFNSKVFMDVTDGESFQNNAYFIQNPEALKIIIYQDAFELACPLGSAKKVYKLLGFYFTLLEIYPYNRSKIDPMQLAILCKENDFLHFDNGKKVLKRFINDLIDLTKGIEIDGKIIKANVVCILGDNLGSHMIGGFNTNFTSEKYLCRYCLIAKEEYVANPVSIRSVPLRTKDNFDDALNYITENAVNHHQGIKSDCIFHQLPGFHVCNPALPPCLGHDLFEGVVKYDLALYVKKLIKVNHWFDLETLNSLITNFKFTGIDLCNKPVPFKAKCDTAGGHAVQTWTLLRFLPVILYDYVSDAEDPTWQAILMLRLVTEYLSSPAISIGQVAILHHLIDEYIEKRKDIFPEVNLRPKHHYLHHYASLIIQFGPLLRVWTMRFESKHTYFKRCIRSSKNFKNVTHTLSEKHQFLQSYYLAGNLFQPQIIIDSIVDLSGRLLRDDTRKMIFEKIGPLTNLAMSNSVTIKGNTIRNGNFLVLDCREEYVGFGKVELIIIDSENTPFFLCDYCSVSRWNGLYEDEYFSMSQVPMPDYFQVIYKVAPYLNPTQKRMLESKLKQLGVNSKEDLIVIEPSDLNDIMTVVQSRKLCAALKSQENTSKSSLEYDCFENSLASRSTSTPESQSDLFSNTSDSESLESSSNGTSVSVECVVPKSDWLKNYSIPWHKFPKRLQLSLISKKRPLDVDRREMIRILIDDLQTVCNKPTGKDLSVIAMRIVEKNDVSFCDMANGRVIGTGHTSLYKQLCERVNNINRKRFVSSTSSECTSEKSSKKGSDSEKYGCLEASWKSDVTDFDELQFKKETLQNEYSVKNQDLTKIETLMADTYPLQRKLINENIPVSKIQEEFPFLFTKLFALKHFMKLTGVDLEKSYIQESKTMKTNIVNFMRSIGSRSEEVKEALVELDREIILQADNKYLEFYAIPVLLLAYFKESDFIEILPESSDTKYIESIRRIDKAPIICVVGKLYTSHLIHIVCEDKSVATVNNIDDAIMLAFSLYYVLNLKYLKSSSLTLEFIQRVLAGINPIKGTKSKKLKGKKSNIHPKVLGLVNKLQDC